VKFFEEVKQLHATTLGPKFELTDEHVTTTEITKVFGNVHKFKTTNPLLTMEIKKKLDNCIIKSTEQCIAQTMRSWLGW
jgi:hypothetical protein